MTDLRLAHLTEHPVTRIWRLKLDAHGDQPSKVNDLPGFHGSIHDEENRAKISGILGTWGVLPKEPIWQDVNGTWVMPVQAVRG